MLETLKIQSIFGKIMDNEKLSMEHTLHVQTEGYQGPHDEVWSQNPSRPSPSVIYELRTVY